MSEVILVVVVLVLVRRPKIEAVAFLLLLEFNSRSFTQFVFTSPGGELTVGSTATHIRWHALFFFLSSSPDSWMETID